MDTALPASRTPLSRRRPTTSLLCGTVVTVLTVAMPAVIERPAMAAGGMGAIVRAFCLSAFENEMSQAGKTPPEGMASFACDCVEERLRGGGTIDSARTDCKQATARRYPI